MLQTPHTFIPTGGPAEVFAKLWAEQGDATPWEWGGRPFLMTRAPEISLGALRHPALQRTWQLELALGAGVLASPGEAWSEGRGVAKSLFTDTLVSDFCEAALHSLEKRTEFLAKAGEIDLFPELSRIALGAFTKYAFGAIPSDEEWQKLTSVQRLLIEQISSLNFPKQPTASDFLARKRDSAICSKEIDEVIDGMLSRCIQRQGQPPEFAKHLQDAEQDGSLTSSTARSQMRNILLASFLTTGILLTNAVREALLVDGLWDALSDEAESAPPMGALRSAEGLQRPISTAIIDETARLFPPVWFIGREATEDFDLGGTEVRAGTVVHVVLLAHQRDPDLWKDPLIWDPTRFSSGLQPTITVANLPFLTGRHICLGQSFARTEASLLVSEIAKSFQIKPSQNKEPVQLVDGLVLAPIHPIRATIKARS